MVGEIAPPVTYLSYRQLSETKVSHPDIILDAQDQFQGNGTTPLRGTRPRSLPIRGSVLTTILQDVDTATVWG